MIAQNLPDSQLLALFKGGDRKAFETLYNRYWKSLYHLSARIIEDGEVAKDLVQEIFISLYEHAETSEITNVRAYIFQSVKFKCFMHLRSGRISEKHLQRMNRVMASNDVDDDFNVRELQSVLEQSIGTLPKKCREVFYLSRFELQSNKKIAEQLNISVKTVEHQITKALKALRLTVDKMAAFFLAAFFF